MTKRTVLFCTIGALSVSFFGFTLGVNGFLLPSATLTIGIVDGDRLKNQAKSFKNMENLLMREQIKAREEIMPIEKELLKEQDEIRIELKENPEKAKKHKIDFDKRVAEVNQTMQKKRSIIEKRFKALSETLQENVFSIIKEIAAKENLSIVLNSIVDEKHSVFYVQKRMDYTDKVIEMLDGRLKNMDLPDIKE